MPALCDDLSLDHEVDLGLDTRPDWGGRPTTRRPGVLVADPDPVRRNDLADHLTRDGLDVWAARTGVEALGTCAARAGVIDAVVVDAALPDLPGMAFLRRFATHFPDVPCVFLVGGAEPRVLDLIAAGAAVLPRTVTPAALAGRLWEVVSSGDLLGTGTGAAALGGEPWSAT